MMMICLFAPVTMAHSGLNYTYNCNQNNKSAQFIYYNFLKFVQEVNIKNSSYFNNNVYV